MSQVIGLPSNSRVYFPLGVVLELRGDLCDPISPAFLLSLARGEVSPVMAGREVGVALGLNFLSIFGVKPSAFSSLRMLAMEEGLRKHSATISVMLDRSPWGKGCLAARERDGALRAVWVRSFQEALLFRDSELMSC